MIKRNKKCTYRGKTAKINCLKSKNNCIWVNRKSKPYCRRKSVKKKQEKKQEKKQGKKILKVNNFKFYLIQ